MGVSMLRRWRMMLQMDMMKSASQRAMREIQETKKDKYAKPINQKKKLIVNFKLSHVEEKDRVRMWEKAQTCA